jgi:hypothetical protein
MKPAQGGFSGGTRTRFIARIPPPRPQNPSGIAKVKNAINMAVQVNRNAIE